MTILFDIFPAAGHYNSCFVIADKLKSAGHRVLFCVGKDFELTVHKKGFETVNVCSRFINVDKYELLNKGFLFIVECFISLFTHYRLNILKKNVSDFMDIIRGINPDIVMLDAHLSFKTMVYHFLGVPVLSVETKPLSLYDPWVPPFTANMTPNSSLFSGLHIQYLWNRLLMIRKFNLFLGKLFLFGQDYYSLHQKLSSYCNFSFRERVDLKRPFITGFKNIGILAMTPFCFDFPRKYDTDCYYAESRVDTNREDTACNNRYFRIMEKIKLQPDRRLVYCSLGTVISGSESRYRIFFKKMKVLSERHPDFIFIMSVGMQYNITQLLPLPVNMYVFQWLPQLDILSRCDIMITHGGMNSISECIHQEVPMLVFPLSLQWDQPGNASRVVYHRLGLKGNIVKDSVQQIDGKLHQIIKEYTFYKQNLSVMKGKMFSDNNELPSWWKAFAVLNVVA